jgi:hypothetical protein
MSVKLHETKIKIFSHYSISVIIAKLSDEIFFLKKIIIKHTHTHTHTYIYIYISRVPT